MARKQRIVLDTSIFVNAQTLHFLGKNPDEAFINFLERIKHIKNFEFYMPPSVKEELLKFLTVEKINKRDLLRIKNLPPKKYELQTPAFFLYELIEQKRIRINKGLRIAEKAVRKALKGDQEEAIIQQLRQEYRVALREGIIDSKEDVDLVLLARQLNAILVSEDQGLKEWAEKLGIESWGVKQLKEAIEPHR